MKKLCERLNGEHTVPVCRLRYEFPSLLVPIARIAIHGIDEDIPIEGEPPRLAIIELIPLYP